MKYNYPPFLTFKDCFPLLTDILTSLPLQDKDQWHTMNAIHIGYQPNNTRNNDSYLLPQWLYPMNVEKMGAYFNNSGLIGMTSLKQSLANTPLSQLKENQLLECEVAEYELLKLYNKLTPLSSYMRHCLLLVDPTQEGLAFYVVVQFWEAEHMVNMNMFDEVEAKQAWHTIKHSIGPNSEFAGTPRTPEGMFIVANGKMFTNKNTPKVLMYNDKNVHKIDSKTMEHLLQLCVFRQHLDCGNTRQQVLDELSPFFNLNKQTQPASISFASKPILPKQAIELTKYTYSGTPIQLKELKHNAENDLLIKSLFNTLHDQVEKLNKFGELQLVDDYNENDFEAIERFPETQMVTVRHQSFSLQPSLFKMKVAGHQKPSLYWQATENLLFQHCKPYWQQAGLVNHPLFESLTAAFEIIQTTNLEENRYLDLTDKLSEYDIVDVAIMLEHQQQYLKPVFKAKWASELYEFNDVEWFVWRPLEAIFERMIDTLDTKGKVNSDFIHFVRGIVMGATQALPELMNHDNNATGFTKTQNMLSLDENSISENASYIMNFVVNKDQFDIVLNEVL